jgi:hypothetical protein
MNRFKRMKWVLLPELGYTTVATTGRTRISTQYEQKVKIELKAG